MIKNEQTPWCVGNEAGFATGFVFTDWGEDLMLGFHSTSDYDKWVANTLPNGFTNPKVVKQWQRTIKLWGLDGAVFDQTDGALPIRSAIAVNNFIGAIFQFYFGACLMHKQASFAPDVLSDEDEQGNEIPLPQDYSAFQFPGKDHPRNAVLVSASTSIAVRNSYKPLDSTVDATMKFFTTTKYSVVRQKESRELLALNDEYPSGFLSALKGGLPLNNPNIYNPFDKIFQSILINAKDIRFDASDLMPAEIGANGIFGPGGGFWGEGTAAVIGAGQSVTYFEGEEFEISVNGKTIEDATQAVQELFCIVMPTPTGCP